ncbi:hypothetical protein [Caballeronia sp. LZ035]|uniref:hypothetical protein n=1 Tax=Caballeronia sp. LZ035 TaxID=3038568 RepID=UPI0028658BD2|nr:hypothetical protein [Caballeronia sp. LZ035]MDR5763230.1 hypothetical protein [Caballeronia sp. LZ035]
MKNTKQPKRATGLADRELAHLEAMFSGFHQRIDAFTRLPTAYWVARLKRINVEYALVVTQQKRLATLMRNLEIMKSDLQQVEDCPAHAA